MRRPHWTPLVVMATAALLLGACSDASQPSGPTAPDSTASDSSAPASTPTASVPTTTTTVATTVAPTTSLPPPSTTLAGGGWAEVPVITSPWGALGWWDGAAWVDAVDQPDTDLTGRYRLLGLLSSGRADAETVGEYCSVEVGGVRPYPELPWGEGDPFPVWSLALSAPWELGSAEVFEAGAGEVAAVSEFLASRGFEVEEATVVQAIRADLFADGNADSVLVAESIGDPVSLLPTAGDYSVVMILPDGDTAASPLLLGSEVVVRDPEAGEIPYTLRVPAIADLNGDGTLEVAVASAYYEGRGINVFAQVEGIRGLAPVLGAGCGA